MTFIDKLALVLVRDRMQLVARSKGKTAFFTPGAPYFSGWANAAGRMCACSF